MEIINTATKNITPFRGLKGKRAQREYATTYDISYEDRIDLRGAWTFARALGTPFNTFLIMEYESTGQSSDIRIARYIAHQVRVYCRRLKIPSRMLWSRHVSPGTQTEQFMMLLYLPDEKFEHFSSVSHRWHPTIRVEKVDYGSTKEYKGRVITVFEYMFRAVDKQTVHKDPAVPCEDSDPVYKPRFFNSFKLARRCRIEHRNAQLNLDHFEDIPSLA